jgi:hypothetical protein
MPTRTSISEIPGCIQEGAQEKQEPLRAPISGQANVEAKSSGAQIESVASGQLIVRVSVLQLRLASFPFMPEFNRPLPFDQLDISR